MARARKDKNEPTVIKKYANRRLYDTGRSSYVTLDDLCEMVKEGHDFIVIDAKSEEDLTRSVLTQIIVEQESRGEQNLLPTGFLRKLISFYGDNVQAVVPNYLDHTLDLFVKNQERMREQINQSLEGMRNMSTMNPMGNMSSMTPMNPMSNMQNMDMFKNVPALEELNKQNMAMFERAMKVLSPFSMSSYAAGEESNDSEKSEKIAELQKNIAEIQEEIEKLSS